MTKMTKNAKMTTNYQKLPKLPNNTKITENAKNHQKWPILRAFQLPAWVSWPEHPKGARGPPTRSWGPEDP